MVFPPYSSCSMVLVLFLNLWMPELAKVAQQISERWEHWKVWAKIEGVSNFSSKMFAFDVRKVSHNNILPPMVNILSTDNLGKTEDTVWTPICRRFGIFHNSSLIYLPLFPRCILNKKYSLRNSFLCDIFWTLTKTIFWNYKILFVIVSW